MKKLFLTILLVLLALNLQTCKKNAPNEIVLGGIFALTGPTSDVGSQYADGVRDYIQYINDKGGINGRKFKLLWKDYKYLISEAYTWYDQLKAQNVIGIIGWGTGDSEALAPKVTADKIPFISASYSEKLANAKDYPYNFIGSVSYSDQARIALKYIKNNNPNAKVAFIFNDTGFGRSPFFPDGEDFAKTNNIVITEKIIIPLTGEGAAEKLKNISADWAIVNQTGPATIAIVKALRASGKTTKIMLLNWALDENVVNQLGGNTVDIYGAIGYAVWNDTDLPGVRLLHEINSKYHPDVKERNCRYIQGYINANIILEAIKRAGDDLCPDQIKKELESLKDYSTGASYNKVSFTPSVHKPASSLKIYKIAQGKLVPHTPMLVTIEQKIWTEY